MAQGGLKELFIEIFAWWRGNTWGTRLWSATQGIYVGTDQSGNRYYRSRKPTGPHGMERRMVIYAGGYAEPTTAVLVPMQAEFFALEGLSQLLRTIEQIRTSLNPRLTIQGVVITMFDKRNSLSEQVLSDVRGTMGTLVYETVIPRNVRLAEAPSYGKPALLYDLECAGSQAYLRLATEVIRRERQLVAA